MTKSAHVISRELEEKFSKFLESSIGLSVPHEKWESLEKKINQASKDLGFENPSDCIRWFIKSPLTHRQVSTIAQYFAIKETYFFRDKNFFSVIENHVLPEIIHSRQGKDQHIQIWCSACCTGEEPYSIAIVLSKLLPDIRKWRILIFGTDINQVALEEAREGKYRSWSLRTTSEEIKQHYFTKEDKNLWKLHDSIRKMVQFGYLNLVDEEHQSGMDLILCNNVLIYFTPEQIQRTARRLTDALSVGGWLGVSAVEVPFINDTRLVPMLFDGVTLFRKESL